MTSQRTRDIQVGLMVVVAIGVLIGGIMFFKRISLDTDMVAYHVDFPAVEGLRTGDRVQARGIRVGQVAGFEIMPGKVRVTIEVEDWLTLHDDAKVVLVMKGLVGEMLVEMEPGDGEPVEPGHVFQGRNAASMLELGDKVHRTLDQLTALSEEVRLFLSQLRAEGQIQGPLAAAERTLLETEGMLKENRQDLRRVTRGLAQLTEELNATLGGGKLDSTMNATRQAVVSLDSTMVDLRAVTAQAGDLLTLLEEGEGTAGKLLRDPALYDRADSTLQSLDRFLDQLRRNPKAMIKMSLF